MIVKIEKLVCDGYGLGRISDKDAGEKSGKVFLIKKALPEDIVEVKIVSEKKNLIFGKIKNIISPSKFRINAKCSHFENCGGCDLQNTSYENQLKFKDEIIMEIFAPTKIFARPEKIIPASKNELYYRNSIRYFFQVQNGKINFARHDFFDKNLLKIDRCFLQSEKNFEILELLKNILNNSLESKNSLWQLKIREGKYTSQIMIEIITSDENLPAEKEIVESLKIIPEIKSIYQTIAPYKSLKKMRRRLLFGSLVVLEKVGPFTFQISPESFFQTNSCGVKTLYDVIKKFAEVKINDKVLDLFCGTGTIGIYLSTLAKKVVGIEIVPEAIRDANDNAKINKIKNIKFVCSDINNLTIRQFSNHTIIVDPPRAGLTKKLIDDLSKVNFKRLIYVSCNPMTFVRDLKLFESRGVIAEKIQPVDMFPQTHHIEIVGLLRKKF
ncbi:MAG: 23S rRNA (uracil-5-)-methyltransferase RumA [Candidatus Berkelbacteria bacterium Athens1014_28]|uniref:23S rRNA (Uracil-5-)-methyltransferase RumA n=1 Tax=Candidatus Berkelbacteria bacterium Athens1014_28 TaxID=2017145 RepID=A0A554LQD3_9BACT|nr:MAG: 23S rRNA (uracil-5-)-methyltransferase RumA [Candidatus Berkelbacteria bacterium Athens1014_28]